MRRLTSATALLLALLLILTSVLSCAGSGSGPESFPTAVETSDPPEATETPDETGLPAGEDEEPDEGFLPVLRFAVCSDVHITTLHDIETERFAALFDTAYAYCDTQTYRSLDAVIVAGDFANDGRSAQMEVFRDTAAAHMREETALLDVMGNHEYGIQGGRAAYETVLGGPLRKHAVINGFHFIGVSPEKEGGTRGEKANTYDENVAAWLEEELKAAAADDPEKPIFTFQHHPLSGTVYGSGGDAADLLIPLYAAYPQVINFAGHSHAPLNHPKAVWQDSFTAVATGTLSRLYVPGGLSDGGAPSRKSFAGYWIVETDANNRVRLMAYDILTGDFFETPSNTDEEGTKLIYRIDCPSDPSTFDHTSARVSPVTEPRFPEGSEITFQIRSGGRVTVRIPQALDDQAIVSYRLVLDRTGENGRIERRTYRFSSCFYLEPMPDSVSFAISGLLAGTEYEVTVYPVNAYDRSGKPLKAAFTTGPAD